MHEALLPESVRRIDFQTRSVEEAIAHVSSAYAPVRMRPITGTCFDLAAHAVLCGGLCFTSARSSSGICYEFDNPFDGYGLSVPVGGNFAFDMREHQNLETDGLKSVIVDSTKVHRAVFSPRGAWRRISVDTLHLHERLVGLTDRPIRGRVSFSPLIAQHSLATRLLLALSDAIFEGIAGDAPLLQSPAALASLQNAALCLLLEALPHNHSGLLQGRVATPAPRQVKRAVEFMHANVQMPIQLGEIAAAAGVSPRSLQLAFRQFRDMTPMAYLRRIRIEGAHADLLSCAPGTKVADVAYRWGFAHMGMFAAQFVKTFGETPSSTLRRGYGRRL